MVSPRNVVARGLVYNFIKVTTASTPFPTEASPYVSLVHKLHCCVKMPLENISFTQRTEVGPKELFQSIR